MPHQRQMRVAALGGNPALTGVSDQIPSSDIALVTRTDRFGRDGDIRQELAEADAEFRKRASLFSWQIRSEDNYDKAYRNQTIDPVFWLERYRAAGVRTPAAPLD